jgi:hypothetical protein
MLAAKETDVLKSTVTHPLFALACVVTLFYILPRFGEPAFAVGAAAILTVQVLALPDSFRSRGGSLIPAVCLVLALWILAGVVGAVAVI